MTLLDYAQESKSRYTSGCLEVGFCAGFSNFLLFLAPGQTALTGACFKAHAGWDELWDAGDPLFAYGHQNVYCDFRRQVGLTPENIHRLCRDDCITERGGIRLRRSKGSRSSGFTDLSLPFSRCFNSAVISLGQAILA